MSEGYVPGEEYLFMFIPCDFGVKMWSCILPAGADWSRVRDRLNPFVWVRGIFVPYLLLSCCVRVQGDEFGLPQLNYRGRNAF